jgi:hypothetical protein
MKPIIKCVLWAMFLVLYLGCSKDNPDEQTPTKEPEVVEAYEA